MPSIFEMRHYAASLAASPQMDFGVYYVAAELVHHGQSEHIYDDAGTGTDPQTRYASPDSTFAQTAKRDGIDKTQLYVYPPFLADALVPITFFSLPHARHLWQAFNLLALPLIAALTSRLVGFRLFSAGSGLVLLGLLSLRPIWICLSFGQVTVLLLLC